MDIMLELDRNMNCMPQHCNDGLFFKKAMDSFTRAIDGDTKNYTSHNLDLPKIIDLFLDTISMIARHLRHPHPPSMAAPREAQLKHKFSKHKKVHREEGLKCGNRRDKWSL